MTIRIGALEITPDEGRVVWCGKEVLLRPMEYRLLHHLAVNADRAHAREALLQEVWRDKAHKDGRTVDVHIARLRRALDGGGAALVTVRRVGYRLDPDRLTR